MKESLQNTRTAEAGRPVAAAQDYVVALAEVGMDCVSQVGGKNASLGEMIAHLSATGVRVPPGFATTVHAWREFLVAADLDGYIRRRLEDLDTSDVRALERAGSEIRKRILDAELPAPLLSAIERAYRTLEERQGDSYAVRSSATAEDLAEASFAGQQESWLNVHGLDGVMQAIKRVYASLYNDRAIAYRAHHGFERTEIGISAGVQRMVRSDLGASGVAFSIDPESGFREAILINSGYGLGEAVVQGAVTPDEFYVYKPALRAGRLAILRRVLGEKRTRMVYAPAGPGNGAGVAVEEVPERERRSFSLDDDRVVELARIVLAIEDHYGRPMDVEWARDGVDGRLYVLQARPETVQSRSGRRLERYELLARSERLAAGRAIGQRVGKGTARVLNGLEDMRQVEEGDVLVTAMTNPDWEPIMQRTAAIVTDRGGRTCHAAIIARELGIPAVVGCGNATTAIANGQPVTVSCAEGDTGYVYAGALDYKVRQIELDDMPPSPVKLMVNVSNPERAFSFSSVPNHGVGLARLEFIINREIGVHPRALLEYDDLPDAVRERIDARIAPCSDPAAFYVERLAEGIASLAAAFDPKSVIVRFSDFKSNEYSKLLGGELYEPNEENPMLGFRGASRYISEDFRACFALECRAIRRVREEMGLACVQVMVPFVRTVEEAKQVVALLRDNGLRRGDNGLRTIMMCELPSNALQAEEFLEYFDGFSIGSNDLTQLTLGLDRDSGLVASGFRESDPAVKRLLQQAIRACRGAGKYVGICGQGPSDDPEFAAWLVEQGIESISLNPDAVLDVWLHLAGRGTS